MISLQTDICIEIAKQMNTNTFAKRSTKCYVNIQQPYYIHTALAGPGIEDLVGVASSEGEESVLAVVVEGAGVVQGRVVSVWL